MLVTEPRPAHADRPALRIAAAPLDSHADAGSPVARARRKKNLVLLARKPHQERDFLTIAAELRRFAPDIAVHVLRDRFYNLLRPSLWFRPTLTFGTTRAKQMRPLRGALFAGTPLRKSEEYRLLEAAGIPIPRWAVVTRTDTPDLSDFDKYVVCKPDFGVRGQFVRIMRKTRVRWRPPQTSRRRACDDLMIQQFIYTGPWPVCYRVSTLFGQVLYAWRAEASHVHRPLADVAAFSGGTADGGGYGITSSGAGCAITLCDDPEILDFARQAAAAIPHLALLGVDIVREVPSGKLYVLELNSCGTTWHFSSETGLSIQRENQINLASQFGGLSLVAKILAEQTRRLAA